jgi:peptidoglycan/xylan/chitin deacetylase (PgdA/CDA1 family)
VETLLQVPVLTYHSVNVIENTYADNDHIALAADLRQLVHMGWNIVPLWEVVNWQKSNRADFEQGRVVAITFDDGSWFDYYDLDHPTCGRQRSFLNILKDLSAELSEPQKSILHATSFVISSPDARGQLDERSLVGKGWWGDEWWLAARESGLMSIECHSWDHDHPDLDQVAQRDQVKGDFTSIKTFEDCEIQVTRAGEYIQQQLNGIRPSLYAYPWGQASDYLKHQYLPEFQSRHQFIAAFGTDPRPVQKSDDNWDLPRFVFGRDWKSPGELTRLLNNCT